MTINGQNSKPKTTCWIRQTSSRRLWDSVVSWPTRWIPTYYTPSILWQLLSPNASSGFFGLPLDDHRVITRVRGIFCCRSCWCRPCGEGSSGVDGRPGAISCRRGNWKYQCFKGLCKSTYESFYDDLSSHHAYGHERYTIRRIVRKISFKLTPMSRRTRHNTRCRCQRKTKAPRLYRDSKRWGKFNAY